MTAQQLRQQLNVRRINKPEVDNMVLEILARPTLVRPLLQEVVLQDRSNHFSAGWIFDHVMRKELDLIFLIRDDFVSALNQLQSDSCIRPMAHVCQMITERYFKKKDDPYVQGFTTDHLEAMVSICFDWLIGERKIATKVFAMTSLFYLGEKFHWVRPELRSFLEQNIASGSPGIQNRGIKILTQLKNLGY